MIKAIYFDLFFTLIVPVYVEANNEFEILDLSVNEWENFAESDVLYQERALGLVKSEKEIINKIVSTIPFDISDIQKEKILLARENRMKAALQNVSFDIIDVLKKLKNYNIKLGLISNADIIDCKFWKQSQLSNLFDDAIFSCDVGILKPDRRIYELAMNRFNVVPSECMFVGDGGSNELYGAKSVGMKTVFTEALEVKTDEKRIRIMEYTDYHVKYFREILNCI